MKVLFVMRHSGYVRNFESVLRLLCDRGHTVELLFQIGGAHALLDAGDMAGQLADHYPGFTRGTIPTRDDAWAGTARDLRVNLDYLRFLAPDFRESPKLVARAAREASQAFVRRMQRPGLRSAPGRAVLAASLRAAHRAIPTDPGLDAFLRDRQPDLLVVTPLLEPGAPQAEYLRSAGALGIRTALCVASWDNLTTKGVIHGRPGLATVWNEMMKREAVELHGFPADRVAITGAHPFDHWFEQRPSSTREEFCARVGLAPERPYILYVCSSRFIAPQEVPFVRTWIGHLRNARSSRLRNTHILVRPHPQNAEQWRAGRIDDIRHVAVWPPAGRAPSDAPSRADYFDSIYHSAAVVGINTTAEIESAIVGRPVYTITTPEFRDTQEGTRHFAHLRSVNGGLLHMAADFDEHIRQLETAVAHPAAGNDRSRRFVEAFVRPYGLTVAATPKLVDALESLAACPRPARQRSPVWASLVRPVLKRRSARLRNAQSSAVGKARDVGERREPTPRRDEPALRRAARAAAKEAADAERARKKRDKAERLDARRRGRESFAADAYQRYRAVREWALRMREAEDLRIEPVASEQHLESALAPLWDATVDMVAHLRHWTEPVSGVRRSDYQQGANNLAPRLKRRLRFLLRQAGQELFVPEADTLGGFGFRDQGTLYNADTLKFFNVLVALQDAAVLPDFRGGARRLVWEIGGGWGGFAYQFKRLCPNTTYVITGSPATLLLSAVYLTSVFPDARCRFYGTMNDDELWAGWEDVDFVFAPEGAVPRLRPPRLDLTLDLATLSTLGAERVLRHVQRSFELGARFFYTLRPAGSGDGSCVTRAIERFYWPHPVPPRRDPKLMAASGDDDGYEPPFAHVVGWKRLRV
jgi:putative sugar O-methyltransferase